MRARFGWPLLGGAALALGPAQSQTVVPASPAPQGPAAVRQVPAAPPNRVAVAQPGVAQPPQAVYQQALTGFAAYKAYLAGRARREGVREAIVQAIVPGLELNQRVVQLDRAQRPPPADSNYVPPLSPYLREHVTPSLIARGQARYSQHWPNLSRIYARFGVDPAVVMAIYGKETSYGTVTGSSDLLDALATLAYEGRRRQLFEDEFIAALKLVDSGVPRWRLKGSYAGATGYPQFMPSVVLRLRADGDGDGFADIWSNEDDAFASIANYLRDAGWKAGVPWAVPARTSANLNRAAIRSTLKAPKCPRVHQRHSRWLTIAEWRSLGVTPGRAGLADTELATLMEPDGPGAGAWLLTNNYRAILDYNCSNYYAMSVGMLADAIARR